MSKLLGIDPGESTGFVVVSVAPGSRTATVHEWGVLRLWHGLGTLAKRTRPDIIIYERWRLYPWAARSLSWSELLPVQTIGVLKFVSEMLGIPCIGQNASFRKNYKLPKSRFRQVTNLHARDALQHLLAFIQSGGLQNAGRD